MQELRQQRFQMDVTPVEEAANWLTMMGNRAEWCHDLPCNQTVYREPSACRGI